MGQLQGVYIMVRASVISGYVDIDMGMGSPVKVPELFSQYQESIFDMQDVTNVNPPINPNSMVLEVAVTDNAFEAIEGDQKYYINWYEEVT